LEIRTDTNTPPLPNPGENGARFIGWLNKKRRRQPLNLAYNKAKEFGLDLDDFVSKMGIEYLIISRDKTKSGQGKEKIYLLKSTWAMLWEEHYCCRRGHHNETIALPKR